MLDFFYSNDFDHEIVFQNNTKAYCKKEVKQLVKTNLELIRAKKENVVLVSNDNLAFIINFFASIFAKKNIYLIDNIQKVQISNDFDILEDVSLEIEIADFEFPQIEKNEILIHLMTSGSSGIPKGVIKSLTNLISEAMDINQTFNFGKNQLVVSCTTTYSHLFGLTFGLMFPLCNRHIINLKTVIYPDQFNIKNSILVSTPSFLDTVKQNNIVLDNAKFIITAGSKLNDETFEYLEKYSNIIEIYGSTETGVVAHKENSKCKYFTPFKNISITSLAETTLVKTPYAYEEEVIVNDKIEIINGQINLLNRTDRLLKIQEKRISAESLEKELNLSNLVSDSYCFKHQDKIACLCALNNEGKDYLLKNGIINTTKFLKAYLKTKFDLVPQKWKFIDIIPKNIAGKIDKDYINHIFELNVSFPIILDRTFVENSVTFNLYFFRNCNFYNGHFPNFPITPGVAQLYFASFLGEYFFNKKLTAGQIRKIKFSNIINAGDCVNLKLTLKENNVIYEYFNEEKTFSSGAFSCENIFKGV